MNLTAQMLGQLSSSNRDRFLANLQWHLSMVARGSYTEARENASDSYAKLRCNNELSLVVATQLLSSLKGEDPAYPDESFIEVLKEKSSLQGCETCLRAAVKHALEEGGSSESTNL